MPAKPKRWFLITNNAAAKKAEIKLRGYIGQSEVGWPEYGIEGGAGTFKEFEQAVEALGNVEEITLRIFSEGGDVHTGMGIHDLIKSHPANWICIIDGLCASAATYAAVACAEVRIPANAYFMIHNAQGGAWGEAEEMLAAAALLESVNNNIADLYAAKCGKSVEEIRDVMRKATWMNGREAVEFGLADTVLNEAVVSPTNRLSLSALTIFNRAAVETMPQEAAVWFDNKQRTTPSPRNAPPPPMSTTAPATTATTPAAPAAAPAPAAPAAPAAAPASAAAPVSAPANAVPTPAPAAAPAAVTAPTNDLATLINTAVSTAVNAAVAPLQTEIENLKTLRAGGVPANAWGGGQPTAAPLVPTPEAPKAPDLTNLSPLQLIALGRKNAAANTAGAAAPTT